MIQLKDINYEIDGQTILKHISVDIYKGKITTIIGPSGAGKSTLLSFFNALKSPTSGQLIIDGKNLESYDFIELRRKVQLVSQVATMINGTVKDNLALPLTLQNKTMTDDEATQFLKHVDLPETFLNKNTKELSGGEKQKVSLARSLVNKPKVMLLDEVTSALDKNSKQAIEDLLKKINKEHEVTMLNITHDINLAFDMSDYIWVMIDGQIAEIGTVDEIQDAKNDNVRKFIGEKI